MYKKTPFQIKSNGGKRKPGFKAFTLIELLVVVAIIAVLVAMLLPAIQKVRKRAKILTCGSQMRQIGIGLYTYAIQNNDQFPPYGKGAWSIVCYHHLAKPLMDTKIIMDQKMFTCPERFYKPLGSQEIGYYCRWGGFGFTYSLKDPPGIGLVVEPCGWWFTWSHSPHFGTREGSVFNYLYLDGSIKCFSEVPSWLETGWSNGNYWAPFDRNDVDEEWYDLKGEY